MKIFYFVVLILFSALLAMGQEEEKYKAPYRYNLYVDCLVPSPVTNNAFRTSFVGIYTLHGSANVMLFGNFYVGISAENSLYKIPTNKVTSPSVNTAGGYDLSDLYQVNSAGINLGHAHYFSPGGFLTTSISIGPSFSKFTEVQFVVPAALNTTFNSIYMQAACGIQFGVEDHVGIGFWLSYTMLTYAFNPYDIALNQFRGYTAAEMKGNMSFVELGFSVYFGYVKNKK